MIACLKSTVDGLRERWKVLLEPIVRRYENKKVRKYFRGDAAFAKPEIYKYLEENGLLYTIRLPAYDVLYDEIKHLLTRPVGRPSRKPMNIRLNSCSLVPNMRINPSILQNNVLGMNNKPLES